MKAMNKKTIWTIVIVVIAVIVIGGIWNYEKNQTAPYTAPASTSTPVTTPTSTATSTTPVTPPSMSTSTATGPTISPNGSLLLPIQYQNTTYGFIFLLPTDWQGFTILQKEWQGIGEQSGNAVATGTEIIIRNPNWTASDHYEDIPVLVFTVAQWNSYQAGNFSISAAPIPATELNANNKYVFALPPRWDYDYSTGYQEADRIVAEDPLRAFNL